MSRRNCYKKCKIMMNNVRGYKSKKAIIERIIEEENPSIIALIETNLVEGEQLLIPGYEVIRVDREEKGGGVLLAYKNMLEHIVVCTREYRKYDCEMLWATLNNSKFKMKIGVVYMPQESRTKLNILKEIYEEIEKEIIEAKEKGYSILLLGDFNCKVGEKIPENNKEITKGGRVMLKMLEKHNIALGNAQEICEGLWTRIEGTKKSVIDYVLVAEEDLGLIKHMSIDEAKDITPYHLDPDNKTTRIYTDHCMVTLTMDITVIEESKQKNIRILDKEGWKKFQVELGKEKVSEILTAERDIRLSYPEWQKAVTKIRDKYKKKVRACKKWKICRELTTAKKAITRELKKKTLRKDEVVELKDRREFLNQQIDKEEQEKRYKRIIHVISELKKSGGVNGTTFWEVRRKLSNKAAEPVHAMKNSEGVLCEEPDEIKKVHRDWFETLLTTEKGKTETERETEEIMELVMESMEAIAANQPPRCTTKEEVECIVKKLNPNKAKDLQNWKNRTIIEGGEEMLLSIMKIVNLIDSQRKIPEEWEMMEIIPTHKKGDKTEMPNKRGLFLTNNISKVYERIVKERNSKNFNEGITVWQNGGVSSRCTVDNVMLTLAIVEQNRYYKRNTYITFTDAEKCFDKLWLSDGIYELWRCGTDIRDCMMIRKLNERAVIVVRTPVGNTEPFIVEEIVRQGTVYGPQICISSLDKINLMGKDVVTFYGPELPIKAVVFMDDVTGAGGITVSNNVIFNCNLLEDKKKVTFNNKPGKTEYVVVPVKNEEIQTEVKKGKINRVVEHKMLGTWIDETGSYGINIQKKKAKLQFMLSETRNQAHPQNVGTYAIDARLKLAEAVIIQGLLHNVEAFPSYSYKEVEELEKIQHQILIGLLELPISTPYYALLIETGFWSMKARLAYRKLMLYHNIVRSDNRRVIKNLINVQKSETRPTTWYGGIKSILHEYKIKLDPEVSLKSKWKKHVKLMITRKTEEEIRSKITGKTKSRTIQNDEYEMKKYLREVNMISSKRILKVRLHMSKLPGNFKGEGDGTCLLCQAGIGKIEHYFDCPQVSQLAQEWDIEKEDLKSLDMIRLNKLASFIEKVECMLEPMMPKAKSISKQTRGEACKEAGNG